MLSNGNGRGTATLLANSAGSHFYYVWSASWHRLRYPEFCTVGMHSASRAPKHIAGLKFLGSVIMLLMFRCLCTKSLHKSCVGLWLNLGHFESRGMHSS